jgi:hypothetical protein
MTVTVVARSQADDDELAFADGLELAVRAMSYVTLESPRHARQIASILEFRATTSFQMGFAAAFRLAAVQTLAEAKSIRSP